MKAHANDSYNYELKLVKRSGMKYRCFSFAYVWPKAFYFSEAVREMYDVCVENKIGIFMDSSAYQFFSWFRKNAGYGKVSSKKKIVSQEDFIKLKDEIVEEYVKFVKRNSKNWDVYCNFDYLKNCQVIWDMQKELEKRGIRPAPVYHGDQPITEWFERYCKEGYKLICIGGFPQSRRGRIPNRNFFERVFNMADKYGVKLHAFAYASLSWMTEFAWWSVDSSTWATTAAYGSILWPDNEKGVLKAIHVSDWETKNPSSYNNMGKPIQRRIERIVEDAGFDFKPLRSKEGIYERCVFNAYVYSHLEQLVDWNVMSKKTKWEYLV